MDVRLPGNGNSNAHGARPVHLIITMIKWIQTSRLSIKNSLEQEAGVGAPLRGRRRGRQSGEVAMGAAPPVRNKYSCLPPTIPPYFGTGGGSSRRASEGAAPGPAEWGGSSYERGTPYPQTLHPPWTRKTNP